MIDELKSFVTVVDAASLTRAADVLCVSQSTISKRIQRLEELMGGVLFDRNAKPPLPTALAKRVYEQAVPVLRALEQLQDIAVGIDAQPDGLSLVRHGAFQRRAITATVSIEDPSMGHQRQHGGPSRDPRLVRALARFYVE
ncbi:LysR family transcriptional regulator, partial [Burkholderia gladioli]|nr:LysR family transcriptional regulator [Burkholderia gladioli]